MRVTECLTFNQYFADERFQNKKPDLRSSKKQAYGDNIYHQDNDDNWSQLNSHHSFADGRMNAANIVNDTQTNRILVSNDFTYWGSQAPKIPQRFRDFHGEDICAGRGHKNKFSDELVRSFIAWYRTQNITNFVGAPIEWSFDK